MFSHNKYPKALKKEFLVLFLRNKINLMQSSFFTPILSLKIVYLVAVVCFLTSCQTNTPDKINNLQDPNLVYQSYEPSSTDLVISRSAYKDKLYGFWLGQCIANWTGLVTEMDKIGNIGEIKTGDFYTREDWGKADQPSIWGEGIPSDLSSTIDFVFTEPGTPWGSDDDTDIEYMYQYLMYANKTAILSANQIRNGWLKHIKEEEENFLWVSNQQAFDLMREGLLPPETSAPENNEHYEMIDAQLTTEIFGLFSPSRPDKALEIAHLPIRTTANYEAAEIAEFYVILHALASQTDSSKTMKEQTQWMAENAAKYLNPDTYPAKMYSFVKRSYEDSIPWEATRDSLYLKYQVNEEDDYKITSKNLYCNGCFAGGINFGASLISLFYGEGAIKETIKIGSLMGWDSDNPTATWGGLLGFMIGKEGIEKAFNRPLSNTFNIHRTRQNFPNNGIDSFENMSKTGIYVTDRVIQSLLGGGVDLEKDVWFVPQN